MLPCSPCRGLAVLVAALALAAGAAAPAEAAKKKAAKVEPPRLVLELRKEDVALLRAPATSSRDAGYAATLPADPWSVLEGHGTRREEAGVPRREAEVEGATEEVVLRRLLEGETIPLLRIKTSPSPPPRSRQAR